MGLVDKYAFEARGARGCGDSDYEFAMTTCCERVGVVDDELHDLYWNHESLACVVPLYESCDCPFCGASAWDLRTLDEAGHVPDHWRWALDGQARAGSRRVGGSAEGGVRGAGGVDGGELLGAAAGGGWNAGMGAAARAERLRP